jgi:hypothetical protein
MLGSVLVYERPSPAPDTDGSLYGVYVFAECDDAGLWSAWLEFYPEAADRAPLRTEIETKQSSQAAVQKWAAGLGPLYLQGALARARQRAGRGPHRDPFLVKVHDVRMFAKDGTEYRVETHAREDRHGTWVGWCEFHPLLTDRPVLRTGSETSQVDLRAVAYWVDGLEPIYFEGAFERAYPVTDNP